MSLVPRNVERWTLLSYFLPGPKGPTKELINAVVEMNRRNSAWGCKRIAQQIALAFGVDIDKDVVR